MSRSKKTEIIIPENKKDKLALAKKAMQEINKKCGETVLDFANKQKSWERLSTGVPQLDEFLGGGWIRGHFNTLWGASQSGKSTLMYHTIAQAQKNNLVCALLDLESSYEEQRARSFGIKSDELIVGRYSIAEQALDTIIKFAKEKIIDIVILDSIHGLCPKGEQEDKTGQKSTEKDTQALLARKLGQFFRMSSNYVFQANLTVILIGQTRTKLGGYITLQDLSGGSALKHYSLLINHIYRGSKSDNPVGKYIVYFLDPDGKLHKRTKNDDNIGFNSAFIMTKKQASGGQSENSKIVLPYHYKEGFLYQETEELPIVIEGTEEEKKKIEEMLVDKELISKDKDVINEFDDSKAIQVEPKKKRGRPKKL